MTSYRYLGGHGIWCLPQELPRGLLKAFSDPSTQTLYLSVCTQLDPWAMAASQKHLAPEKRALGGEELSLLGLSSSRQAARPEDD